MFPLERITDRDVQELCETLWSWQPCLSCSSDRTCEVSECSSNRKPRLARFITYYKSISRSYAPDVNVEDTLAIATHQDLFRMIRILKAGPELTRTQFSVAAFTDITERDLIPEVERDRAIDLVVRVVAMVSCVAETQSATLLEAGRHRIPWRQDVPFSQFISDVFPTSDHPTLNDRSSDISLNRRKALKASKLKKHARLAFEPTDDIRSHLRLDHKTGTVQIFHHTAFLKEHLRLTKDLMANHSIDESLKRGALPRQLVLEILDSIQDLLFPLTDPKSRTLLQSLTSTRGASFDPDCLRFDSSSIRRAEEKFVPYYHLGERLMELYAEGDDPQPRGRVWRWLERRSRPRFVMLATLAGVIIAVLLGLFGLTVQIYQTWITYQAWKHPVQNLR
jgi:hypothetical protein